MEHPFVAENAQERARLRALAGRLTDADYQRKVHAEWTVADALGHIAFWEQVALVRIRRWKERGVSSSPVDFDLINDALVPLLRAIPPRDATNLAIAAAEAVDRELAQLSQEMVEDIQALGNRSRLFRSEHRRRHLDQIEAALRK
jgi:hypothetical protein